MKNTLIILLLTLSFAAIAGNNKVDKTKEAKAREWIKNQPLEFVENKGQFMRTDGKAADEVLFKTTFGNCDIYITDKGLSYVFVKMEEVEQSEIPKTERYGKDEKGLHKQKIGEREEEKKKLKYYRLDMNLEGANISKSNIIKENESKQGHYNYFYAHCPEGIYDVKAYGKITIKNIYKGIDWVIYTNSNSKAHPLKYDFVVHPEADYKDIKIKFLNAQNTSLSNNYTKLKIETIAGNIEEGNLYSYQNYSNNEINSKYIIDKDSIISFKIANYDTTKTLVIDPLVWATYYGGSLNDFSNSICIDSLDNIYIAGYTASTNFPIQQLTGAYFQSAIIGNDDIFILKFNHNGVRLLATYYGGSDDDDAFSICTDSHNNIYITGHIKSLNFPTQQLTGAYWQPNLAGLNRDVFIVKFNDQGVRLWATFYGGSGDDAAFSICADSQDNIYLSGWTNSSNFPILQLNGAYNQANYGGNIDAFIIKLNNQGVRLWGTYYGGNGQDILNSHCFDINNNIYLIGHTESSNLPTQQLTGSYWQSTFAGAVDLFILKFNNQSVRQWATYYGGSSSDYGYSICTNNQNYIYITGITESANFPTEQLTGAYWQTSYGGNGDAYILKFNNQGVRQWATYYGGNNGDYFYSVNTDSQDNIYITGCTSSSDFPTFQLAGEYWQQNNGGGYSDATILIFNNQGVRQWSTYYGTNSYDFGINIGIDKQNSVYFIGNCSNNGAYTLNMGNGAFYDDSWNGQVDSYILKIKPICNNQNPISLLCNKNNLCINDNDSIILTAIGGMGDTLKWYFDNIGQNYIGKNSPLTIPSPTQTTTYYARWESDCDTSDCDSIVINVLPINTIINNPNLCQGESFQVGIHNYTLTGNYSDTLISHYGCDSIINTFLTVKPSPMINLGNDITICEGTSIFLNSTYPNASYLWQDNSTNPIFTVTQAGQYWVKATIDSCSNMDSINIAIKDCEIKLELPNIITPNNDTKNDLFIPILTKNIEKMNTQIFNRWGNLIFETDNLQIEWDGKYNGTFVADGVYFWIINYRDTQGKEAMMKGTVSVLK